MSDRPLGTAAIDGDKVEDDKNKFRQPLRAGQTHSRLATGIALAQLSLCHSQPNSDAMALAGSLFGAGKINPKLCLLVWAGRLWRVVGIKTCDLCPGHKPLHGALDRDRDRTVL